jgi:hypothetical protein
MCSKKWTLDKVKEVKLFILLPGMCLLPGFNQTTATIVIIIYYLLISLSWKEEWYTLKSMLSTINYPITTSNEQIISEGMNWK